MGEYAVYLKVCLKSCIFLIVFMYKISNVKRGVLKPDYYIFEVVFLFFLA